jgi:hypothetical protein
LAWLTTLSVRHTIPLREWSFVNFVLFVAKHLAKGQDYVDA